VQLLVDGKVVQDQTPTGQSSDTVSAFFDSLVYTEGYLLPVQMQVWDSAGNHYDCTLKAIVHLPQVQFSDLWTPDYTAAPVNNQVPQIGASTGATIGGNTTLHLRSVYGALTLTTVRLHLHSDPDTTKDTVLPVPALASPAITNFGPPVVYSLWDARCGDPDPSLPTTLPVSQYGNVAWNIGGRNGVYDVTATFKALGAGGVVHTLTSSATFDREDLLITGTTPANPTPLLWDPAKINPSTGTADPLPLSATFTCAYKANGTTTVKIYASNDNVNPVRTLTQAFTTKDGSVSLPWDGTADPVNGQPGLPQTKGVYLFQWFVSDSLGVSDTDKSSDISFLLSATIQSVSDDGTTAVYQVSYNLRSADIPVRSASSGQIDVFDYNLLKGFTQTLASVNLIPGPQTTSLSISSSQDPSSIVVSAQDNDADSDRGQRKRFANIIIDNRAFPMLGQYGTLSAISNNSTPTPSQWILQPAMYELDDTSDRRITGSVSRRPVQWRSITDTNGFTFTGTNAGFRINAIWPGGRPYDLKQMDVYLNGTHVATQSFSPTVRAGRVGFDFDSTHYSHSGIPSASETGYPIQILVVLTTTAKGPNKIQRITSNDFVYNYASILGNQTTTFAQSAVYRNVAELLKMNHLIVGRTDHAKNDILNDILNSTVFYIGTHGLGSGFGDCFAAFDANGNLISGSRVSGADVSNAVSKKQTYNKPPMSFAFIDGCATGQDTGLEQSLDVLGWQDAGYLGWHNSIPDTKAYAEWSQEIFVRLRKGEYLAQAQGMTYLKLKNRDYWKRISKSSGHDFTNAHPVEKGDPYMTLFNGLYGMPAGTTWYWQVPEYWCYSPYAPDFSQ
jgi:hypothetical protein